MLLNLCFAIVRRLFSCGCKLLWILSQRRPAGCIRTEVQAWRWLWSSYWRHKPELRIASDRLLLLGASTLSHWGTYVTFLQHCLKPLCCIVCGTKKRKVALSRGLCSAPGPRLNNLSPCPAPLLHEKCLQFLYTWNFHGLICICCRHQKASLKPWLCFLEGDLLSLSLGAGSTPPKPKFEKEGRRVPGIWLALTLLEMLVEWSFIRSCKMLKLVALWLQRKSLMITEVRLKARRVKF